MSIAAPPGASKSLHFATAPTQQKPFDLAMEKMGGDEMKMTRRILMIEGLTMHADRMAVVGGLGTRTKLPPFEKNGGARFQ